MSLFDNIGDMLRGLRVYILGRGLVSLMVATAGVVGYLVGLPFLLPTLAIAVGSTLLHAYMRTREQRLYEEDMVKLYRNDIASTLGIEPTRVTRADLHVVAEKNEVIAQALTRQQRQTRLEIVMAAVAGAITFGLLYVGLAQTGVATWLLENLGKVWGGMLAVFSVGIVSGLTSFVINEGVGYALSVGTGLNKAVAHDRILDIQERLDHGRTVTADLVFGVLVASDYRIDRLIKQTYGERFKTMTLNERRFLMESLGVVQGMEMLAKALNERQIQPGNLAFMLQHGVPNTDVTLAKIEETAPTPERGSFVERYAPERNQKTPSFVERLALENNSVARSKAI